MSQPTSAGILFIFCTSKLKLGSLIYMDDPSSSWMLKAKDFASNTLLVNE